MSDDRRKNAPTGQFPRVPEGTPRAVPPAGSAAIRTAQPAVQSEARKLTPRDPRAQVVVPVRYRYESIIDFHETQSANISKTGMFVVTSEVVPQYTIVEFEVSLADGFLLMKGKAEVARVSTTPPRGLGLRFVQLDDTSVKLITRIVEVNSQEGKKPTVSMDFAPESPVGQSRSFQAPDPGSGLGGVTWKAQDLSIQLNTATVSFFVYNPLLNIRLGGFVVPAEKEVPLGTLFTVSITTPSGESLFTGKGKVVAKHEKRLGIRLVDVDKAVLARLQAEVNRLVPSNK
jgi:PilZ domain